MKPVWNIYHELSVLIKDKTILDMMWRDDEDIERIGLVCEH